MLEAKGERLEELKQGLELRDSAIRKLKRMMVFRHSGKPVLR